MWLLNVGYCLYDEVLDEVNVLIYDWFRFVGIELIMDIRVFEL